MRNMEGHIVKLPESEYHKMPSHLQALFRKLPNPGSEEVLARFPFSKSTGGKNTNGHDGEMRMGRTSGDGNNAGGLGDEGSAARFFYSAKASKADRAGSKHPTVKPVKLMQWLVRMITPPGGTVLDPFAGSGTTGHAALLEGFNAVLIEREAEYRADITRRIELALSGDVEKKSAITKKENTSDLPLFGDKP